MNYLKFILAGMLLLLMSGITFAQPECVILLSPTDGEVGTPLSVDMIWEAAPTGETPTSYTVFWGTTSGALNQVGTTTNTTFNITSNVLGQTLYWRIEATGPTGTTAACTEFSYTTLTLPVAPVIDCGAATPVSVTFDLNTDTQLSTDWTGSIGDGNDNGVWNFKTGGTPSSNTGPCGGVENSQYLYFESSGSIMDAEVISPSIDLTTAIGDIALEFNFHAYGSGIHQLDVLAGTSATGPFDLLWSWNGALQSTDCTMGAEGTDYLWELIGLDVSNYAGETLFLVFRNTDTETGGSFGDMAIDQISINGCEELVAMNNNCNSATILATGGESGSLSGETTNGSTDSGLGGSACNAITGTDVFYSIESDVDGGGIIVDLTAGAASMMNMVLYSGTCGVLVEEACVSATSNGENITLNYFDPNNFNERPNGSSNRMSSTTFILRVYDENNAGEIFDLDATGSGLAALPVSLSEWNASLKSASIELNWRTESEFNTDKFIIEKSYDGNIWRPIGEQDATGFSAELNKYNFTDSEIMPLQYYRLNILDFDGSFEYSGVIQIKRDDIKVGIFPNPASTFVQVSTKSFVNDVQSYQIYSLDGRMVKELLRNSSGSLNIQSLNSGIYQLVILDGNQRYIQRFTKE